MKHLSLELTLATKESYTVGFPAPGATKYKVEGILKLEVQKAVQLKRLTATFIGQGDIATTDSSKLKSSTPEWGYFAVARAVQSGLLPRKKQLKR
ncbi:hypothetical protein BGW38_001369 [Lunasporangiospora selenospora]|uniref:Uncharacterized protein n=1 Tax=Lunasporangiospora selenospora TaxID=979761 RepID=A0A9P6G3J3_9FUNG|nr:hypothetical protein BGW38_001369 [Lunasporangiospora selenospora]